MVIARQRANFGILNSVVDTTSTGVGASFSIVPTDTVAIQTLRNATAATGTEIQTQGSLDGSHWFSLGAAQTYATTGITVYLTTGAFLASFVRANVNLHTSTGAVTVDISVK